MSDVPEYALIRYRNGRARPRVTSTYRVDTGWEKVPGRPIFTQAIAALFFVEGVTLVKLRWRRVEHEVPVYPYGVRHPQR